MDGTFADWVVPGLMRHGSRCVMTGGEGYGKSTLIYQLAMGAAYGVSPLSDGVEFEPRRVYVLDEPTTGLHLADVEQLLGLLDRLVDSGKSVVVIAHHQAVMAHADWIIDLGPGAGHDGGRIVFEGTPADLVAARSTLTGEHLATYLGA